MHDLNYIRNHPVEFDNSLNKRGIKPYSSKIKTIDEDDKGRDVSIYKIFLFNMPLVIALGDTKYTFIDKKILYAPVYLVVDDSI